MKKAQLFSQHGGIVFRQIIYRDEFSRTNLPVTWPDESTLLSGIQKDSTYKFADDINTAEIETVADMVLKAWKAAMVEIKKADGEGNLAWGKFKNTGVRHLLRIPALSRLSLTIGGGANIINATTSDHGPSWRMIVQLSATTEAYGIYPGGQNGNPGSKYYDNFIDHWAAGKYFSLIFVNEDTASRSEEMKWKMTFEKA